MERVLVVFAAPIPLGHRVEISWYERVERGLVPSQSRTDWRPHEPLIRDLDTGVEYSTDWGFGHGGRTGPDLPAEVEEHPLEDFRLRRRLVGVLHSCRVVTVHALPRYQVQTRIEVQEG